MKSTLIVNCVLIVVVVACVSVFASATVVPWRTTGTTVRQGPTGFAYSTQLGVPSSYSYATPTRYTYPSSYAYYPSTYSAGSSYYPYSNTFPYYTSGYYPYSGYSYSY